MTDLSSLIERLKVAEAEIAELKARQAQLEYKPWDQLRMWRGECLECAGTGYQDRGGARIAIQRTPCSRGCLTALQEQEEGR